MSSQDEIRPRPTWQIIHEVSSHLESVDFTVEDIIQGIKKNGYEIKETAIRSHIIGMSPNHPSSVHQPFLRNNHPVFKYLGGGKYTINNENTIIESKPKSVGAEKSDKKRNVEKTNFVEKTSIIDNSPTIVDVEKLGDFYILISSFEKDLREIIKNKFGKGIYKILQNQISLDKIPDIISEWEKRRKTDQYWGIAPEKELLNYALLTDYMEIIKNNQKYFTVAGDEEMQTVIHQLKQFATFGRNPLMHCRTLSQQKYYTTISSVNYLKEWIRRIQK